VAVEEPSGRYDLLLLSGVLYEQYDYRALHQLVAEHAAKGATVVTCHIKDWERPLPGEAEHVEEFPYREYTEVLRRYRWQ
jgi:predicted nicotinamide N-methyase